MKGIKIWKNPKNRFAVFELHYLADPAKQSKEFKESIKNSMPRSQYLQEYELQWDSFAGLPVYPDFSERTHVRSDIKPQVGLPLLRGWDWGLTPACVVCQLQEDTMVVLKEFTEINMGADRFSNKVLGFCNSQWPTYEWKDFIDPAGNARVDTDENTCAKILAGKGLKPIPGAIPWEERRQSVEHFMLRHNKQHALMLVEKKTCPQLIRGFVGGYRYAEKTADIEPNKIRPLKDEHSHVQDAFQMVTSRVVMMRTKASRPIPKLDYGWNRNER